MKEIFDQVLGTFENADIQEFAKKCIDAAPPYFFEVPASSSLKYHPAYACTVPLGLAKHTAALVRFLNHMLDVESIGSQFTSRERDLLRVAGIAHDMMKSGSQEEYEHNKYTKFDHPLMAAGMVRGIDGLNEEEKLFVANAIKSHMGQWNTDKRNPNIVLPKPQDKYQIIIHLADYLASRKDIDMQFDSVESESQDFDPKKIIIDFGKYKGMSLDELYVMHRDYIEYLLDKEFDREPMHTYFVTLLPDYIPKNRR